MFHKLNRIVIKGIWNRYPSIDCDLKLNSNVTIFVGKNGSGKTTVLKIIKAFLSAKYDEIFNCPPFSLIELEFKSSNAKPVKISGKFIEDKFVYIYKKNEEFVLDARFHELNHMHPRARRFKADKESLSNYKSFKKYIDDLVTFDAITINRDSPQEDKDANDYSLMRRRRHVDNQPEQIDSALERCINQVSDFHKNNFLEINKLTDQFFRSTFSKLLIPDEEKLRSIKINSDIITESFSKNINLHNEIDEFNKEFFAIKEKIAWALSIVSTFNKLHDGCEYTPPNRKIMGGKRGPEFHSTWCRICEAYGGLQSYLEAFQKFKGAKPSSRAETILKVERTCNQLVDQIKKCNICYKSSKEYFSDYWLHPSKDDLKGIDILEEQLYKLSQSCMRLIDIIHSNKAVSDGTKRDKLIEKLAREIEENEGALKDALATSEKDFSQVEMIVSHHNTEIKKLLVSTGLRDDRLTLTRLYIHERITEILKDYKFLMEKISEIMDSIDEMCEIITEFIDPKTLDGLDGKLTITDQRVGYSEQDVDFKVLSSGEKQLIMLLIKVFLAGNSLITLDEPELSLHIGWQQKLLDAMYRLNPNAQLIVATHSPEIAAFNEAHIVSFER